MADTLALLPPDVKRPTKVIVSEAGASVYSASELAAREFPDLDVSLRGAVSIARRLQDPLAELVKIEPKAIGVGQYQHDVDQYRLARSLDAVVEDAVNAVGVDLNMASAPLLAHVAGLGPRLAEAIVAHRDAEGAFTSRKELLKVPGLGPKAFEQCAGFLRIRDGAEPLDASAVHPEAYGVARRIVQACGRDIRAIMGNPEALRGLSAAGLRRRRLRPAHGAGYSRRAGEARPRPAPRFRHRPLRRRRRDHDGPEARHGSGGHGDQRRRLRRLRRYGRASGRAWSISPPLGDRFVKDPQQRGQGRRRGQGARDRGRPAAQALALTMRKDNPLPGEAEPKDRRSKASNTTRNAGKPQQQKSPGPAKTSKSADDRKSSLAAAFAAAKRR